MRRLALAPVAAILAALALGLGACANRQVDSESTAPVSSAKAATNARAECACAGEVVVDPALLAFLSKARAAHHQADLAEDEKDTKRALAALAQITSGPLPGGASPPAEVAEVIADARARLADLEAMSTRRCARSTPAWPTR